MINNTKTIIQLASEGKRLDNRGLLDYRQPIKIETSISKSAEGSAKVTIGDTVVLAGVKMSLEKPYSDSPNEGGIMVNAELIPLSSSEYEPGPPGIKAVELARVTDRGIRESHAIDFKKLCIEKGEKAWFVIIDIVPLNDAGNLFDAAGLAALAALKETRLRPIDEKTGAVDYKGTTDTPLPLLKETLSVTVGKVGNHLMVDPTVEEESSFSARLTVATDKTGTISALQKGGDEPMTIEEVGQIVDIALDKAKFLRSIMDECFKNKK
ncbi:exosome complex protein Rrp42 [archaeon]|jgi:exosome complex component RRP42|nr:exosome complex protein Rrp42 [archaeon]MBT3451385.1 exosome complex protein Rrp42 [archaeon]MBT6868963.1 exosome complex protein Rrp42 [archaeon]MBT7193229.1 exosome complex protein Rrp42 [archaeon]MBT7380084.1 exosome complex protein Rrp42 [archaeon]